MCPLRSDFAPVARHELKQPKEKNYSVKNYLNLIMSTLIFSRACYALCRQMIPICINSVCPLVSTLS